MAVAADYLADFSRQYYVPLIDYRREGDWLLVASGAGTMMAVMDVEPRFRWCFDIDSVTELGRLSRWMAWAENLVGRVAVAGWFSITDPGPLKAAVAGLRRAPLSYTPMADLGVGDSACGSLEEFLRRLDDGVGRREEAELAAHRHGR